MDQPVRKNWSRAQAVLFLGMLAVVYIHSSCGQDEKSAKKELSAEDTAGKQLSEIHCRACHAYPSPDLLDRNSWSNVLFSMEMEMNKEGYQIQPEDWLNIQRYYLNQAPTTLPLSTVPKKLDKVCTDFQKTDALKNVTGAVPIVSLLKYEPTNNTIYAGDIDRKLMVFSGFEQMQTLHLERAPIDVLVRPSDGSLDVLCIGEDLMPTQGRGGEIVHITKDGKQERIIDFLDRPVQFLRQDFNEDGKEEYLVACFGSLVGPINSGKLTMFIPMNGIYKEKIIKEMPGAIKAVTSDFNQDGKPDIVALFAQGREQVSLFLNKGNLEFEEKQLLEFPPVHGSNDFVLADINGDSYPDIILTNGDNGDNSPVFKPYHGVRVFLNNGKNEFSEKFFFPVNGASRVLVRDFDVDNDLDMVVLAMYPNLAAYPQESLLYFENQGKLAFDISYFEPEPSGRWVLMDAGDIDEDGDLDVIVGSNLMMKSVLLPPKINSKWMKSKLAYGFFENIHSHN
ncbi:MAG: hypothetical protein GC192_21150 [Bacteroidetes bacterium]|nr:hypothetical protein [Bacteroidota bacterium]